MTGSMTISLDFELLWGRLDTQTVESYGQNILGGRVAIERMLNLFEKYDIHATWGIVGFLYANNMEELNIILPQIRPEYSADKYSPYNKLDMIKQEDKRYFFAPELISTIRKTKNQEIATHTFSHYYCLEEGQNKDAFEADIAKAVEMEKEPIQSIIFPRNQCNEEYNAVLKKYQIKSYRGNPEHWCYKSANKKQDRNVLKRAFRLLDMYIPICGNLCYRYEDMNEGDIYNIPASRFLRPYSNRLRFLEGLRVLRIKSQMTYAAKKGQAFHLWWHPHNFGMNTEENLDVLEKILKHYNYLHSKYDFRSLNMKEVREYCDENSSSR